jgi:hypothetical protein
VTWKLKRLNQCAKCPWKVSTDPHDIPDGYSEDQHRALSCTIAEPGSLQSTGRAMSCHEHSPADETHCVGWVAHQLGPGNNIGLRMSIRNCENAQHIKLHGEQHQTFEATLP